MDQVAVRAVHCAAFGVPVSQRRGVGQALMHAVLAAAERPLTTGEDSLRGTFRYARAFDRLS